MYKYPDLKESSVYCQKMFNNCETTSGRLKFDNPVGCWKDWAEACATPSLSIGLQVLVVIIVIIAFLSFIGNTIVCVVFCVYDQLRLVKHYFVVNLAVVDNILAVVAIPMFVAYILGSNKDTPLCRAQIVVDVLCGTASIVSLAVISIERYIAVVIPLHYDSRVTPFRAIVIIIFTWFYSVMVSLITLLAFAMPDSPASLKPNQCLFFGGEFVIFITVSSFILPVAIMACAYWKIFLVAHVHAVRIQAMVPSNLPETTPGSERQTKLKGELKAAKTLTIIMGTHIICWCPLFIYFLVFSFCDDCRSSALTRVANYIILVLRYYNTLANPIIYAGINRQFRAAIKKFVLRKRGIEELSVTVYTQAT